MARKRLQTVDNETSTSIVHQSVYDVPQETEICRPHHKRGARDKCISTYYLRVHETLVSKDRESEDRGGTHPHATATATPARGSQPNALSAARASLCIADQASGMIRRASERDSSKISRSPAYSQRRAPWTMLHTRPTRAWPPPDANTTPCSVANREALKSKVDRWPSSCASPFSLPILHSVSMSSSTVLAT